MRDGSRPRVALVTGAAGGVGASVSAMLAAAGYRVALADLDHARAEHRARGLPNDSFGVRLNVADATDAECVVRWIAKAHGAIDVLVNSAGILATGPLSATGPADWDNVCRINLSSIFYCCKAVMPSMIERRSGRIVNVSSISAAKAGGVFGNVLYGTAKAGVNAFTKGFARELGPYGVTVNAVEPGLLATPMTHARLTPEVRDSALASIPVGRLGTPEDVAAAVVFLVSEQASYINGAILTVDGGRLAT